MKFIQYGFLCFAAGVSLTVLFGEVHASDQEHFASDDEIALGEARIKTSLATAPMASPGQVVVVYFTPSDRAPAKDHTARICRIVEATGKFYEDELTRHGFEGRKMRVLNDPQKNIRIVDVRGKFPDRDYGMPDGSKIRDEVLPVLTREGIRADESVLLMFCNLMDYDAQASTISHHSPYYGGGSHLSGNAWQCDSEILDPLRLTDGTKLIDGQYGAITIGKHNTIFLGGVIHELGHALSLPHCRQRDDESVRGTALMGSGNQTYGEELRGEGRGTFLTQAHAIRLAAHPVLNPTVPVNVTEQPTVDWRILIVQATDFQRIDITGELSSSIPVHGVVAYFDPRGGSDYDATTATAVPDESGTFKLQSGSLRPGRDGQVRVVVCHINGVTTTKQFPYKFDRSGKLDLSIARFELELQSVLRALEKEDLELAAQRLSELSRGNPELAATGARVLDRFRERAGGPKTNTIDLATLDVAAKQVPLSAVKPDEASVGWQSPAYDRQPMETELISVGGDYFARGIYAHAPAQHRYELNGKWDRLTGKCGLVSGRYGKVDFEITGDGRRLWGQNGVVDGDAIEFGIDVKGVSVLRLVVTEGDDGKNSDHAFWIEPTLKR